VLTALTTDKFIFLDSKLKISKGELLKQQVPNRLYDPERKSFAIADTAAGSNRGGACSNGHRGVCSLLQARPKATRANLGFRSQPATGQDYIYLVLPALGTIGRSFQQLPRRITNGVRDPPAQHRRIPRPHALVPVWDAFFCKKRLVDVGGSDQDTV
jgi:hypothetical protein